MDKKEIYTYEAPFLLYGMNWSTRPDKKFRLAVGSFIEDYNNRVEIIQLNEEQGKFNVEGSFIHPYPTTKIMWIPDKTGSREDLLATTGDYLRLWKVDSSEDTSNNNNNPNVTNSATTSNASNSNNNNVKMSCLLNNNKNSEFCAPLTSFDWNDTGTSKSQRNALNQLALVDPICLSLDGILIVTARTIPRQC
jgi:WD repeat-containing protein 68